MSRIVIYFYKTPSSLFEAPYIEIVFTRNQLTLMKYCFFEISHYYMRDYGIVNKPFAEYHVIYSIKIYLFFIGISIDYQRIVSCKMSSVLIEEIFFVVFLFNQNSPCYLPGV